MACIHCVLVQGYLLTLIVPALLGRHLAIGLGLASGGCCIGEMLGLVSMWYEGPGKQKTPVNKSCYSF